MREHKPFEICMCDTREEHDKSVGVVSDLGYHFDGDTGETRVVDPETGGEKGSKPAQLTAVHAGALLKLGEVAGFGASKYARHNFLKGYAWSLSSDAHLRHFLAWQGGEDNDPESGLPHLAHAAWHDLALLAFQLEGLGTDDRWKR